MDDYPAVADLERADICRAFWNLKDGHHDAGTDVPMECMQVQESRRHGGLYRSTASSWDQDDPKRVKFMTKRHSDKELAEMVCGGTVGVQ